MNENSLDESNSYIINKSFQSKGINDKTFMRSIILLNDILKDLEKELENKNNYSVNDKNKIKSLFSLLYFELTFIQQISKINANNHVSKNQNEHIFNNTINYNKELLSKKIEQFLFFYNDKNKNVELYKNCIQNTCINNENNNKNNNQKVNPKIKGNFYLKKKVIINHNNNININKTFNLNKKINNENLDNRNKKNQIINNNNKIDVYNAKMNLRYCYDTTLKNNKINKVNNLAKNLKKIINKKNNENRNKSKDNLKLMKSNKNILNNLNLDKINDNNVNEEKKNSNLDLNFSKTINNFYKPSKSKDNLSNNDISILNSSVDEKDDNPIRKVKNIIKKVRNKNNSVDCKLSHLSKNEKNDKLDQKNNKEENNKNINSISINDPNTYKLISKSGFLYSTFNDKDKTKTNENIRSSFCQKAREAKEILFDCMNQIQKKLNSNEKNRDIHKSLNILN